MRFKKLFQGLLAAALLFGTGIKAAHADEAGQPPAESSARSADWPARAGVFGLSGEAGYYTYGMDDVNNRYLKGRDGNINGGLGYGAALKFGLTNNLAAKVGIDYLFASTDSSRTINGARVNSRVDLPATMLFLGGEYVFLPLGFVNFKAIGGYTLVNIYNGKEKGGDGYNTDLGTVAGTGSGGQFGAGVEFNLARGFSLETDLAYNFARIDGATFTGAPADPGTANSNGSVDYSGLVAKVAFTIYLVP